MTQLESSQHYSIYIRIEAHVSVECSCRLPWGPMNCQQLLMLKNCTNQDSSADSCSILAFSTHWTSVWTYRYTTHHAGLFQYMCFRMSAILLQCNIMQCCLHNQWSILSPLPFYDLFMAARYALSQPCLQHFIACMQVYM